MNKSLHLRIPKFCATMMLSLFPENWGPLDLTTNNVIDLRAALKYYHPDWNIMRTETIKTSNEVYEKGESRYFVNIVLSNHDQIYSGRYVITAKHTGGLSSAIGMYDVLQRKSWTMFTNVSCQSIVAVFWACILLIDRVGHVPQMVLDFKQIMVDYCHDTDLQYHVSEPKLMNLFGQMTSINGPAYTMEFRQGDELKHTLCIIPNCWNNRFPPFVVIDGVMTNRVINLLKSEMERVMQEKRGKGKYMKPGRLERLREDLIKDAHHMLDRFLGPK